MGYLGILLIMFDLVVVAIGVGLIVGGKVKP